MTDAPDAAATTSQGRMVAYLMLALVAMLWAANTNIARATAEEVPPMALTFWRLFLSALVFAPFALRQTWRQRSVVMQHFWLLNWMGFLSMAAFNGLVYLGMQYTVAINGNLLQGALPICIILSGILFARRKVTTRQGIGVALGMLGLMTIIIRGDIGLLLQMRINPGDPLLFVGIFCSATYAVFLYKRPAELDLMSFMFLSMAFATFHILPFFIVEHFWFRPMPVTQTTLLTVGFIALIGVAVNNTILLVDAANQERNNGATAGEAIQAAVTSRFRPLVATTITTVAGLLPLSLSDPFWESLGFTIMGGLLSSTFLVIVSFPAFYLGLEAVRTPIRNAVRRRRGRDFVA